MSRDDTPVDGTVPDHIRQSRALTAALRGAKLLVVEDHRDTRDAIAAQMRQFGALVAEAASAQMALLLVEADTPDALLIDLALPDIDGWQLLESIRRLPGGHAIPAVAVTAHNEPADRRKSLLAGFRLHIPKPVDAERLGQALAALLAQSSEP